jgi:hypothetical protein
VGVASQGKAHAFHKATNLSQLGIGMSTGRLQALLSVLGIFDKSGTNKAKTRPYSWTHLFLDTFMTLFFQAEGLTYYSLGQRPR